MYSGPSTRCPLPGALSLSPRLWAYELKVDGVNATVTTDATGRIGSIRSRNVRALPAADTSGLLGLATGLPDAELHGELEAHTEAGIRAAATRGWSCLHLFDLATWRGCDVTREPYAQRYSLLHRWQAAAELGEVPRVDWWRTDARGDSHDTLGRYTRPVPADLRRLPIVQLHRGKGAAELLWHEVERSDAEGMVAVRLDAPMGARGAKLKVKAGLEIDATVLRVEPRHVTLSWAGNIFAVGRGKHDPIVGETWEVACDGMYERDATPRFARLVRVRDDIRRAA